MSAPTLPAPPDGRPYPPGGWAGVILAGVGLVLLLVAATGSSDVDSLLVTGGVLLVTVGTGTALYNFIDARPTRRMPLHSSPPSPRPYCDGCGRATRRAAAFCPTCGKRTAA